MKRLMILLLLCGTASGDLVNYFNNQFIPVEKVELRSDTVLAYYNMDLMMGPEEFDQDIAYILGTLAKEYPGSEKLQVICSVAGEPRYVYKAETGNIESFAKNKITAQQLSSRITVEEYKGDDALGLEAFGGDNSMLYLLGGVAAVGLFVIFLMVLGFAFIAFRRRKK